MWPLGGVSVFLPDCLTAAEANDLDLELNSQHTGAELQVVFRSTGRLGAMAEVYAPRSAAANPGEGHLLEAVA